MSKIEMRSIVTGMFDMALVSSRRNASLLVAASRFFDIPLWFDFDCISDGIVFQSLAVVEFIFQHFWTNCTNIPHVYDLGMDPENYLLEKARKNPQPYVSIYATFLHQTYDDDIREMRMMNWRQLLTTELARPQLDLLKKLAGQLDSRLAYLVRDIREFVLQPYVENFLLYV